MPWIRPHAASRLSASALAVALCALARAASAAPPDSPRPRKGLYLHAAMGPALIGGNVSYSGQMKTGGISREYSYADGFSGLGADVNLAAGWAPLDGLAIALEGRAILQVTGSARLPHATLSYLSLQSLGGLVDYYPAPTGPFHVDLGAAYAQSEYASVEDAVLVPGSVVVHADDMSGVLGHAGVGYDWRAKTGFQFGPVLDVWTTRLTSAEGRTSVQGVSLTISAGWM